MLNYSNYTLIILDTLSSTSTMLRLISFINESDGRYVHDLEPLSYKLIKFIIPSNPPS